MYIKSVIYFYKKNSMYQTIIIALIFVLTNTFVFAQNSNQKIEVSEEEELYNNRSIIIKKEKDTVAHLYYESELCHFAPFLDIEHLDSLKKKIVVKEVCDFLLINSYKPIKESNNLYLKWSHSVKENISYEKEDSIIAFQTYFKKVKIDTLTQLDKAFWISENRIYIYREIDDKLLIEPNSIKDNGILYYVSDCFWNENGTKLRHPRIKKVLSSKTYIIIYENDGSNYVVNKNTAILTQLKNENIDNLKLENDIISIDYLGKKLILDL